MPAKSRPVAEMLAELEETLAVAQVRETRIKGDKQSPVVHGAADFEHYTIYIDPVPGIVSTLVHEAIHLRWPSWSEQRVAREERRVFGAMTPEQIAAWWKWYRAARVRRTRPYDAS
jgi:hypothetical protein